MNWRGNSAMKSMVLTWVVGGFIDILINLNAYKFKNERELDLEGKTTFESPGFHDI